MFLTFEAAKPFIADRMGRCIKEVFGRTANIPHSIQLGGLGRRDVRGRRHPCDKPNAGHQSATGGIIPKWQSNIRWNPRTRPTWRPTIGRTSICKRHHSALYYLLGGLMALLVLQPIPPANPGWLGGWNFALAFLLPWRGISALGSAKYQQSIGRPGQHLAGQRGHHLRHPDDDPVVQCHRAGDFQRCRCGQSQPA